MARRLQDALRRGSYLPTVGRELQSITAAATAGWLAYDAGWQDKARRWWLETCHFADVPDVRVSALAAMALQASNAGDGRETVDLVQAARKAALRDQNGNPRGRTRSDRRPQHCYLRFSPKPPVARPRATRKRALLAGFLGFSRSRLARNASRFSHQAG